MFVYLEYVGNYEVKIYKNDVVKIYYEDVDLADSWCANGGSAIIFE